MLERTGKQIAVVKSEDRYISFPALTCLDNGDILLAFRSGRNCYRDFPEALCRGGHPHTDWCSEPWLARSRDDGASWTIESSPRSRKELDADHAAGIGYQDVGFTKLPDGRAMLSVFRWRYANDVLLNMSTSVREAMRSKAPGDAYDYSRWEPFRYAQMILPVYFICDRAGKNWTPMKPIDVPEPGTGRQWAVGTRNGGVLLDDDTVGWPFYFGERPQQANSGCHLLKYSIAKDQWAYGTVIAPSFRGIGMEEPLLHRHPDGSLLGFYRRSPVGHMFFNSSHDNGITWSQPMQTAVWGHPFSALTLANNDILLAYGYRRQPFGIRMARLAGGDVNTFDPQSEIIVRDDAPDDDIGYPSLCCTKDGTILLAYYFRSRADANPIRYVAVERWKDR